jgi:hypothetical protein
MTAFTSRRLFHSLPQGAAGVSATNGIEPFHLIGRPVQVAEPPAPTIEDCYRNLVAAVFLQAKKDLRDPGYRRRAALWLRSQRARHYAEMLGIEPDAVEVLLQGRSMQ